MIAAAPAWRRRLVTVPSTFAIAAASIVAAPLWVPAVILVDLARGRRRLPLARLGASAAGWAALESAGVARAAWLWLTGRSGDQRAHLDLQRWWIDRLVTVVTRVGGIPFAAPHVAGLGPGPLVVLSRHASIIDSVLSAWVLSSQAGLDPRYVLKRELLTDPCLDIVGNRLHNHFLDRRAADQQPELDALRQLGASMGPADVAVIFPEGTRVSAAKRTAALAAIAEHDPERARRLGALETLLPPRPAGTRALLEGCPAADVIVAWHVGLDGLDTVPGILRRFARRGRAVEFHWERIPRAAVPSGSAIGPWLDEQWLAMDRRVTAALTRREAR